MATQKELDQQNKESLVRQRLSRERNDETKSIRDAERAALSEANSTSERRKIKEIADSAMAEVMSKYEDKSKAGASDDFHTGPDGDPREESEQSPATTFESNNPEEAAISEATEANEAGSADGLDLVTFDVVKDDNTAGQYQWRAEEIT